MRSLSDSTRNVKVTSKVKEDEQNDKINNLIDEVNDLDSRMDAVEGNVSALSETVSTNTVIANDMQANEISANTLSADTIDADVSIETKQLDTEDITSTGIARLGTLRATSGNIVTLESQNATIENATITNADITNIDIDNLSGTNMSYENGTFDDIDVNNNIDVDGNIIVGGNVTASGSLTASSGDISSLSSNEINATDVDAVNVESTNGKITFLQNRHLIHDDNYVDINQVVSDTDFVIIELPKIQTGDYRVTYKLPETKNIWMKSPLRMESFISRLGTLVGYTSIAILCPTLQVRNLMVNGRLISLIWTIRCFQLRGQRQPFIRTT